MLLTTRLNHTNNTDTFNDVENVPLEVQRRHSDVPWTWSGLSGFIVTNKIASPSCRVPLCNSTPSVLQDSESDASRCRKTCPVSTLQGGDKSLKSSRTQPLDLTRRVGSPAVYASGDLTVQSKQPSRLEYNGTSAKTLNKRKSTNHTLRPCTSQYKRAF